MENNNFFYTLLQPNCEYFAEKLEFFALAENWREVTFSQQSSQLKTFFDQIREKQRFSYYVTLYHLLTCEYCLNRSPDLLQNLSHPELWRLGVELPHQYASLLVATQTEKNKSHFYFRKLYEELVLDSSFPKIASVVSQPIPLQKKKLSLIFSSFLVVTNLFFLAYLSYSFLSVPTPSYLFQEISKKELLPVGTIISYYGTTPFIPEGFLLCDGSRIKNTQYFQLVEHLAKINPQQVLYHSSDGEKMIRLPDLQGLSQQPPHAHFDLVERTHPFTPEIALLGHVHGVPLETLQTSKVQHSQKMFESTQEVRSKNVPILYLIKY